METEYKNFRPKLIIIRGPRGSGKTTIAEYFKKKWDIPYVESDQYFTDKNGVYHWDHSKLTASHNWVLSQVKGLLVSRKSVIVTGVFRTRKSLEKFLELKDRYNVDINIVRCTANYGNTHNVPQYLVDRARATMEPYPGEQVMG